MIKSISMFSILHKYSLILLKISKTKNILLNKTKKLMLSS